MRTAKFDIYQDTAGDWRWRLKAANGRIIADGAEGYSSRRAVVRAVRTVKLVTYFIYVDSAEYLL